MGANVDMEDLLSQMFGFGGMPGMGGTGPRKPRKGRDEEKPYEITLEEMYAGKSKKFAITKTVVCGHCKGKGGKENARAKECATCRGKGNPSPCLRARSGR